VVSLMTGRFRGAAKYKTAVLRSRFKPVEINLTATMTATGSKTGRFRVAELA
jgi:hypothetical protein